MTNKLSFDKPIFVLAPLAGFTDLPFRSVVKKFGADLTVSEMLSSNALAHNSTKTLHMLEKSDIETVRYMDYHELFRDLLIPAILLLLLEFLMLLLKL